MRHMISHDQAPGIPEPVVINNAWQTYGLLAGFGLSIPVFFVTTYGWVVSIVGPLLVAGCTGSVTARTQIVDSFGREDTAAGVRADLRRKNTASLGLPDQSLFNKPQN